MIIKQKIMATLQNKQQFVPIALREGLLHYTFIFIGVQ